MRKVTLTTLLLAATMMLPAQNVRVVKGDCTPAPETTGADADAARSQAPRRLPTISTTWDADREYHQLVVLFSFSDTDFSLSDDPRAYYDDMLNKPGFEQRQGAGSMADYFREQSGGRFNVVFDVYGPYKLSTKAQPYDNPTDGTRNYGRTQMQEATRLLLADQPGLDYSQYDWNGDGKVNQVIYIYAGLTGNQSNAVCYGHIWPNTSSFTTITTPDGKKISDYTASAEKWTNGTSCGIGTICHEYTHSLGLPDIYPTSGNSALPYSVLDEWDLMDGGNFTNNGSCPPAYTPMERMLLGWLEPVELTEPTTITGLKPLADGGDVYLVRHTATEYLLLENRQQRGWDYGLPGQGLVIYHVNYLANRWSANTVNNIPGSPCFSLFCADNLDYEQWYDLAQARGLSQYQNSGHMNSRLLSTAPYPWVTDSTGIANDSLTDSTTPAAVMVNENADGSKLLSKAITNIRVSADGLVSFDFMGGGSSVGLKGIADRTTTTTPVSYDLAGRRQTATRHGLNIERRADGSVTKTLR